VVKVLHLASKGPEFEPVEALLCLHNTQDQGSALTAASWTIKTVQVAGRLGTEGVILFRPVQLNIIEASWIEASSRP
jgi:hypothetical protein